MLVVFTRAIIIYIFLLFALRLMGKRQLGELQPFEFVITLIVSELACIPIAETSIPLGFGLIPIFTLFILHFFITKIATKSIKMRNIICGKPVILMDGNGINSELLKQTDMNINDLMEALRAKGYFNPSEVAYAILETNGTINVMPKAQNKPATPSDLGLNITESFVPFTLVMEGKLMSQNIVRAGTSEDEVLKALAHYKLAVKDVLLLLIQGGDTIYLQPMKGNAIIDNYINILGKSEDKILIENKLNIKRFKDENI